MHREDTAIITIYASNNRTLNTQSQTDRLKGKINNPAKVARDFNSPLAVVVEQ